MSDTAGRWARTRALFDAALAMDATERAAFLQRECPDDAALRDEVAALLAADERAAERLGHAVRDAAAAAAQAAANPLAAEGQRIGPWRLVRELGQGGMGTVFLAERVDGSFTQQVALKLVRRGMDSEQILQRFEAERQILASLDHPRIARLVDGGITADGAPWFAMELVEGDPIDRYCATQQLDLRARLRLFAEVCRAVSFAHSRLVVHRDLKPDNIFVTRQGEVRLLDFGIAKVLSDAASGTQLTQTAMRVLTPGYASPEQVRGERVTTASDVYSLGVVLYELLTGQKPHDLSGKSLPEVERIVSQSDPQRPSTRVPQATRLSRQLRGDLDVICLKALRHEPERRYESVSSLHDDIQRHLDGRTVRARPDTLRYRVRKFVGRNRASVAALSAAAVLLVSVTSLYLVRLAEERDLARGEAAKAAAVAEFLQGIFEVADPALSRGDTVTARELLDRGATRIERELDGQPDVQAVLMRVIGETYSALGLPNRARPLLEGALERHRGLHGTRHAETATSALALGQRLQDLGELEAAEPLLREALATRESLYDAPNADISEALRHLAFWEETAGNADTAEALFRAALAQDRELFPPEHERVVTAVVRLGGLLRRRGAYDEAEPLLREGLATQRRIHGDTFPAVTSTMRNLASLRRDQGDFVEAESLYLRTIELRRALYGETHPDIAIALNSYALLLSERGDHAAAISTQRELLAMFLRIYGGPHPSIAAARNNLAEELLRTGNAAEAEREFRRAIAVQDAVLPIGHVNRAYPLLGLGRALDAQGRRAAALRAVEQALRIRQEALPEGSSRIAEAEELLASLQEPQTEG